MHRPILVTGATGRQGGAVVRHLLQQGMPVRALVRNLDAPAAQTLSSLPIEIQHGDLSNPKSIEGAVKGCAGLFSVQNYWEAGYSVEVAQGVALIEAAVEAQVEHFVYSSAASAHRIADIPLMRAKREVELHLLSSGLSYTIIRPTFFMENWERYVKEDILLGRLPQPLRPDTRLQQVAVNNIGLVATRVFRDPGAFKAAEIELAGDARPMAGVAESFSEVLGRPVVYEQTPWREFEASVPRDLYLLYRWMDTIGFAADIPKLKTFFPQLQEFCDFLSSCSWLE